MSDTPERAKRLMGHGPVACEICEALGLDPNDTSGLEFSLFPNQPVKVIVHRWVRDDAGKRIAKVIDHYNLVPEKDVVEVTPIGATSRQFARASDAALQKIVSRGEYGE